MPQIPFKRPVPEYRTIVDGIWSDILDNWLASFRQENGGTDTAQHVALSPSALEHLKITLAESQVEAVSQLYAIKEHLAVLNLRFEEAFETRMKWQDVDE